ncbi:flavin reductase family protein [Gaiella occulta]|uniref:flavin reductase family protein n=1 Tax=Gaiella occulta TaxID=1002870 RepID=UPI003BEEBB90
MSSVALRLTSSAFATGVVVVTCRGDADEPHGLTVNSFTAVSLEPPLVLVSIDRRARACRLLAERPFGVNVLDADQERLATHFAGRSNRDVSIVWESGTLVPLLADALAFFECEPWRDYDGGDHVLFLGRVVLSRHRDGDGLGFFRSRFFRAPVPAASLAHHYDPFELPYDAL